MAKEALTHRKNKLSQRTHRATRVNAAPKGVKTPTTGDMGAFLLVLLEEEGRVSDDMTVSDSRFKMLHSDPRFMRFQPRSKR